MDKIEFRVQPSPNGDEHEVRVLVNGTDIIPNEMFGLDPVQGLQVQSLLEQTALIEGGELWFARGYYETDEGAYVQVSSTNEAVTWRLQSAEGPSFVFNAKQYDEAVSICVPTTVGRPQNVLPSA